MYAFQCNASEENSGDICLHVTLVKLFNNQSWFQQMVLNELIFNLLGVNFTDQLQTHWIHTVIPCWTASLLSSIYVCELANHFHRYISLFTHDSCLFARVMHKKWSLAIRHVSCNIILNICIQLVVKPQLSVIDISKLEFLWLETKRESKNQKHCTDLRWVNVTSSPSYLGTKCSQSFDQNLQLQGKWLLIYSIWYMYILCNDNQNE